MPVTGVQKEGENTIMFILGHARRTDDNLFIYNYTNITHINSETKTNNNNDDNENVGDYHIYTFYPTEDQIAFDKVQLKLKIGNLYIQDEFRRNESNELKTILDELKISLVRRKGRNLAAVKRLDVPSNVQSMIGSFLSGKPGTVAGQANQLQQNTGVALAPRPSGQAVSFGRGGKRTRKNRKYNK